MSARRRPMHITSTRCREASPKPRIPKERRTRARHPRASRHRADVPGSRSPAEPGFRRRPDEPFFSIDNRQRAASAIRPVRVRSRDRAAGHRPAARSQHRVTFRCPRVPSPGASESHTGSARIHAWPVATRACIQDHDLCLDPILAQLAERSPVGSDALDRCIFVIGEASPTRTEQRVGPAWRLQAA